MSNAGVYFIDEDFLDAVYWDPAHMDDKIKGRPFVGPLFYVEDDEIDGAYYAPVTSNNRAYSSTVPLGSGLGAVMLKRMMYIPRKYLQDAEQMHSEGRANDYTLLKHAFKNKQERIADRAEIIYTNYGPKGGGNHYLDYYALEDWARTFYEVDNIAEKILENGKS